VQEQAELRPQGREVRRLLAFRVDQNTPFGFGVAATVRHRIEAQENTRLDRVHFKEYGDSALVFEVVYYMLVPDYNAYMDTQQQINLALFQRFEQEGIEFAYPTRTLYLQRASG